MEVPVSKPYRAYPLDASGKMISDAAHMLEAESNEQVIEAARPYVDGHDIEVRHGNSLIETLRQHDEATLQRRRAIRLRQNSAARKRPSS